MKEINDIFSPLVAPTNETLTGSESLVPVSYSDWVIFRYICTKPVYKSGFNWCKLDSFVILIWLDSDIYLIRSLENRLRWVNSGIRTLSLSSLYLIHSVFGSRSFMISHMICESCDLSVQCHDSGTEHVSISYPNLVSANPPLVNLIY